MASQPESGAKSGALGARGDASAGQSGAHKITLATGPATGPAADPVAALAEALRGLSEADRDRLAKLLSPGDRWPTVDS